LENLKAKGCWIEQLNAVAATWRFRDGCRIIDQVKVAIQNLFGVDLKTLEASPDFDKIKWKQIGLQPMLGNSMVTAFTYDPLVGVTSQTVPSGQTTYFKYDGLGRLVEEYNFKDNVETEANRRVIKQYEYHFTNSSTQ